MRFQSIQDNHRACPHSTSTGQSNREGSRKMMDSERGESSSAGPSGFARFEQQQPCTSASASMCLPQVSASSKLFNTSSKDNVNWRIVNELNHNSRPSIYNRMDPNIQLDMRAFYNCMEYEEALQPNYHYFTAVQEQITPFHREQAIDWIYDVAIEEKCDGDVFLLAVNLIDRFLSVQNIMRHDIQMIAGVCLFIASKLKAPSPLTVSKIAYYSDNSCPVDMILQWELLIVTTLQWETDSPTAFSFFDFLASRIPEIHGLRESFQPVVQKCQRMHKLSSLFPSMQCAIALYYVSNLTDKDPTLADRIKTLLANMFQLEVKLLDSYIPMVQRCLNPKSIYTAEDEKVELIPGAPAPTQAPEQEEEEEEEEEDEDEEEDEGEDEDEDDDNAVMDALVEFLNQEEEGELLRNADPHESKVDTAAVVFQSSPMFEKVPVTEQIPLTPLNDSGFSSDVSSPASSEKKRRRSTEWFDGDRSLPKLFKFL